MATTSRRMASKKTTDSTLKLLQDTARKVNESTKQAEVQKQKAEAALRNLLGVNENTEASITKIKKALVDSGGEGFDEIHKLQVMNEINTRLIKGILSNLGRVKNLKENTLSIS